MPAGCLTLAAKLARLVTFRGRADRAALWVLLVDTFGVYFVWGLAYVAITSKLSSQASRSEGSEAQITASLGLVTALALLITASFQVRRCHDRGRSGWFLLLWWLPGPNIWGAVELYCLRGTPGPNRFDADPIHLDLEGPYQGDASDVAEIFR